MSRLLTGDRKGQYMDVDFLNILKKLRRYAANTVRLLVLFFVLGFFYELDPFGLSELSEHQSEKLYQQWTVMLRPSPSERITVVMLSDTQLDAIGYPERDYYQLHGEVLERLLELEPKAVFMDLGFVDYRPGKTSHQELLQAVADYRDAGTPLFFSADVRYDLRSGECEWQELPKSMREELITEGARPAFAAGGGVGRDKLTYPFACMSRPKHATEASEEVLLYSAAPLMCGDKCAGWLDDAVSVDALQNKLDAPLLIRWRLAGQSASYSEGVFPCRNVYTGIHSRFWHSLKFPSLLDKKYLNRYVEQSCPPQSSMSVTRLLYAQGDERQEVESLLKSSYVIYGAYLAFAEDVVDPPTHTLLPGAFHHAMALENLLSYEANYFRDTKTPFLGLRIKELFEYSTFFLLLLILEYARFVSMNSRQMYKNAVSSMKWVHRITHRLWVDIKMPLLALLVLVTSMYLCAEVFRQPVPDFIGLLALLSLSLLPTLFRKWETFKDRCRQILPSKKEESA